jgi:pyruvyltransferase
MFQRKVNKQIFSIVKKIRHVSVHTYRDYLRNDSLIIKYWDGHPNWGDSVNHYLFQRLTGHTIVVADRVFNVLNKEIILGVGSIIAGNLRNHVIWGSGFLSEQSQITTKPKTVLAVRGVFTFRKFQSFHIQVPQVFGDPALLFPDLFHPKVAKRYPIGLIPHFKENSLPLVTSLREKFGDQLCIIDMTGGIEEVAEKVLQCEAILSSSLHGLILAEAYGIPTARVIISDKLIGGHFKFDDYYSGVGILNHEKTYLTDMPTNLAALKGLTSTKDLKFSKEDLKAALLDYIN